MHQIYQGFLFLSCKQMSVIHKVAQFNKLGDLKICNIIKIKF